MLSIFRKKLLKKSSFTGISPLKVKYIEHNRFEHKTYTLYILYRFKYNLTSVIQMFYIGRFQIKNCVLGILAFTQFLAKETLH